MLSAVFQFISAQDSKINEESLTHDVVIITRDVVINFDMIQKYNEIEYSENSGLVFQSLYSHNMEELREFYISYNNNEIVIEKRPEGKFPMAIDESINVYKKILNRNNPDLLTEL